MIKYFKKQRKSATSTSDVHSKQQGQALLEYVLILVIAMIGLIAILAITAPAIGNVWSNTVFNLLGQTTTPQDPLEEAEFWEMVTAVASYTPEAVNLITNTPPNPTIPPTAGPSPTVTPTIPTATATDTATPGPSPTPEDRDFGFPFSDNGDDDTTFQGDDFLDLFAAQGPWNAEYWGSSACSSGSIFNASTGDGGGAEATAQVDKIDFPDANLPDDYWQTDYDRPYPGISDNFCSRFENTVTLEAKTYTLQYRKDDGVRVYIDGALIIDDWNWSPNNDDWITFDWVSATAGPKFVRIVHRDTGGGAKLTVQLTSGGQTNTDRCNWHLASDRYRSAPTSWHSNDDFGANYYDDQYCVLRLRGTINLTNADNPFLEFYDAYELDRYTDRAIVGISIAGSGVWNDIVVHEYETNFAFQRQSFRLSSFTGSQGTVDYRDQIIELRFVLETDSDRTDDGWWIDDITIENRTLATFAIGFFDDVEGSEYWVPNGDWARSSEHVRSGSYAWTDSPGGAEYAREADTSLELNGRLDLTQGTVDLPQISFWHSYDLATTYDAIYVELSTDYVTWEPLRSGAADTTDYIAQDSDSPSFVQEVVDIPPSYWGLDTIFVRFRLSADTNWNTDDGWWIDDIEFRNKPQDTIRANWCDDVESGTGNWIPGGDWATTPGRAYDGNLSWTDSPGDYIHGSNSTLELKPYVDMAAPLTRPVFEFWHSWNIQRNEGLYVEVSVDDGNSWSVIWSYTSGWGNRPFGFGSSISAHDYKYNNNQTWVREMVELSPYIGIPPASPGPSDPLGIRLRFRLDARSNTNVADGWYVDAICVREVTDEPVRTIPFAEDFEAGSDNWFMTGDWSLSAEETHGGANALSDSSGTDYSHDTYSYVELRPTIDLTTATNPVLYFFERYTLEQRDRTMVIVRPVDATGAPLGDWEVAPYSDQYRSTNLGWTRNESDISAYAGQYIRVRFLIDALHDGRVDDGWWIDDVQILDRDIAEAGLQYSGDPFFADFEVEVPGEWVYDHEWDIVNSFRDQGSGGNLGPGQWTVEWYDQLVNACSSTAQIDMSSLRNTTIESEIDFNWGNNIPSGSGLSDPDDFGAIFRRQFAFPEATTFRFVGDTNNGMRIYDNGVLIYEEGWTPASGACNAQDDFESAPYTFTAGIHNVEVHYYDSCCSAYLTLGFAGESGVLHDSPSGDYEHRTDTRVELEGEIDLAGTVNPIIMWDQRHYIGWGDSMRVEVSDDGGFTWSSVYSGNGDNNNWNTLFRDLSSYAGQKITIRFRLDARSNSNVDDGWYIDNVRIFE